MPDKIIKTLNGYEIYDEYARTQLNNKADSSHNHSASEITSGTLSLARGGTGATTAAAALANLGITISTSAAPSTGTAGTIWIQML